MNAFLKSCTALTVALTFSGQAIAQVKELGKPRGGQFKDWLHAVSFSGDGRWLAAGDMAGAVQVWEFGG